MTPGGLVLDAGAGNGSYRELYGHMQYESTDFGEVPGKSYAPMTFFCNLCEGIPVESERYDYIIVTQVLEHLPDPQTALAELVRVLKPGGRILCSSPLFYEEHERPYDFFRYTQFAYRHMFARNGLQIETLEPLEGYFGTIAYMFQCMFFYLPVLPHAKTIRDTFLSALVWPFVLCTKFGSIFMAAVFYRLDKSFKIINVGFPKNYVVIAMKS
jgi:SAM-dependent methyltransferase